MVRSSLYFYLLISSSPPVLATPKLYLVCSTTVVSCLLHLELDFSSFLVSRFCDSIGRLIDRARF
jgi:hypothetical protein